MKNLKKVITNIGIIIAGILTYVFMGCANLSSNTGDFNLYDSMKEGIQESNPLISATGFNLTVVAGYFLAIFAGIMILVAIVNLLCNLKVIKNAKVAKILGAVNVIVTIIAAIAAILALIGCAVYISDMKAGDYVSIGWAAILNLIIGVLAAICGMINVASTKKSK